MNLALHLAQGYDHYQHGRMKPWTRAGFAEALHHDPKLLAEAREKLLALDAVKQAHRTCHISTIQHRILSDGLRAAQHLADLDRAAQANPPAP